MEKRLPQIIDMLIAVVTRVMYPGRYATGEAALRKLRTRLEKARRAAAE